MPRTETILQVFIASPSDVKEEREVLESVITELNRTWSTTLDVRFDLKRWETSVHPAFGRDPQDVINKQVDNNYDIFIGVLWGRIGTPTPRAESGTLEEFERAYTKYLSDPSSVELMIYFKDAPISPSKMDPLQLTKVQEFQRKLGERGGLYRPFEGASDFESAVRAHLSAVAQKWAEKISRKNDLEPVRSGMPKPEENNSAQFVEDDELGFLDYTERYEARMTEMSSALTSMGEATINIGVHINKRTEEINTFIATQKSGDTKGARKIIKLASEDLKRYANTLNQLLPIISSSRKEAFDALSKALVLYDDFRNKEKPELETLEKSLSEMQEAAGGSRAGLLGFRMATANLPRLSVELNQGKREVIRSLDRVLSEVDATIDTSSNIIASIVQMKSK